MRRWLCRVCVAMLVATLAGGGARAAGCGDLAAVRARWADALQRKDIDASVALYTADGTFFEPSGDIAQGAAAIRRLYQAVTQRFDSRIVLTSQAVRCAGAWASDQGSYAETLTDRTSKAAQPLRGSYLMVLQRGSDQQWRIAAQMWTAAGK